MIRNLQYIYIYIDIYIYLSFGSFQTSIVYLKKPAYLSCICKPWFEIG